MSNLTPEQERVISLFRERFERETKAVALGVNYIPFVELTVPDAETMLSAIDSLTARVADLERDLGAEHGQRIAAEVAYEYLVAHPEELPDSLAERELPAIQGPMLPMVAQERAVTLAVEAKTDDDIDSADADPWGDKAVRCQASRWTFVGYANRERLRPARYTAEGTTNTWPGITRRRDSGTVYDCRGSLSGMALVWLSVLLSRHASH